MQTQEEKTSSSTLKRNPKIELSRPDLLKLLSYLEGELQARDVVIAALKSEKVKQLLVQGRFHPAALSDPLTALQRDSSSAAEPRVDEAHIRALADHQVASLENLVLQNRKAQIRMARILKEAEERHRKVVQELEDEKCKHEHDTAQGDDITYGLEKDRTRLKQELELERQNNKKMEKELKKAADLAEEERSKQKQIVLLLLADRKKVIMKYIEERKRSEDLAQILSEEKGRVDSMAEGLEEESKKALQMEAELEKHLAQFDTERQQLRAAIAREEKRARDAEVEVDNLKKRLTEESQSALTSPPRGPTATLPGRAGAAGPSQSTSKPANLLPSGGAGAFMSSMVSKVVQPTATVSSVPVCGPTTGIARCVSPGQSLRATPVASPQIALDPSAPQVLQVSPHVSLSASPGTKVFTTTQGGKVTYHVKTNSAATPAATPPPPCPPSSSGITATNTTKKLPPAGRGAPPPVPPNKPVVLPKKPTDLDPKSNKTAKPASPPRKLQA
ncbi:hypothetical protein B566_EDAN003900 [Ephemera danica]|nr:hypothetical protein B566_EDAN003900 [Ephemera danica]